MSDKLPDGWRLTTIGDLAEFQSGGTPPKKNDAFWGHDVPFVTAADLRVIEIDRGCARSFLTEDGWNSGKTAQALPGSVLLGTRTGVGRVGVATERIAASQDITVLDCVSDVDPRWLARFLSSRSDDLVAAASGATIQGITRKFLKGIEVALPPLDEQHYAVARLDEQLATAERARVAARVQLAAIEAMPQALLRQIFPRSPVRELLADWRSAKLGEVCEIVNGSTPKSTVPEYWDGDICWVTPTDLGQLGKRDIERTARSITRAGYDSCSTKLVPPGTVVMSSRAPIGHLAIAATDLCTNQGCKSFVPASAVESEYLYHALRNSMDDIRVLGAGATFAEVSKRTLAEFAIPIPPIAEQRRIVRDLNEQTAATERARAVAQVQLDAIGALPAAVLRLTFTP